MYRLLCSVLLFFGLLNSLYASGQWFISPSAGATFPSVSDKNYISSGPGWPNDTYTHNSANATPFVGIEGGYQWKQCSDWFPYYRLGASYTYVFATYAKGDVDQYSLPQFKNYNYQYKIQWQTLLANAKLDLYRWQQIMPFLSIGAGTSFNNASNYTEQPRPNVTPRVNPAFSSDTYAYFAYVLGAGLDYMALENLWLSLKYEYGHEGYMQTGYGANTPTLTDMNYSSDRLHTQVTSQSIVFSATYLFDLT